MDLSGLRETISTREKSFPARSRMVGSVSGKSIIVPRIRPLGWGANWPHAITNRLKRGKARGSSRANLRAGAGQFQLQKGLFSETIPLTAESAGFAPAVGSKPALSAVSGIVSENNPFCN